MTDTIDRLPCNDVTCAPGGHQTCQNFDDQEDTPWWHNATK